MKVVTPRLILHHASIGSRCLPRLVTAWTCWLQVNFHIWVTLLAIRSWRPWMCHVTNITCYGRNGSRWWALASFVPEIDIFASSTGDFNIIALDHMKKLEICCH